MDKASRGILQFYTATMLFKIQIFWNMVPRRIPNSNVLGGAYCLHLQGLTTLLKFPRRCMLENSISCNFLFLHLQNTIFAGALPADGNRYTRRSFMVSCSSGWRDCSVRPPPHPPGRNILFDVDWWGSGGTLLATPARGT
jgi:hypothetical protein